MKHFASLQLHGNGSSLFDGLLHLSQVTGSHASALPGGRQTQLEPGRPLSPVALVDEVSALQKVAGSRNHRCLGLELQCSRREMNSSTTTTHAINKKNTQQPHSVYCTRVLLFSCAFFFHTLHVCP